LLNQHRNVAMKGAVGAQAVKNADERLGIYFNMPPGPERLAKAFAMADQELGAQRPASPPRYSQDSAPALSGVAGNGGGGGSGSQEEGVTLTPLERETAKRAGLSAAEYARWKNPEKYIFGNGRGK